VIDLISEYISLAIEHGKTTLSGDYKRVNRIHAKMIRIIDNIKNGQPDIKEQFYTLMHHDSDSVKIWTAVTLLKTFEDEALTVLKCIEKEDKDIFALNAKMSIDSWTKGMLTNLVDWNRL
jgi:hypothetical protein